jgi:hypothetical protein
MWLLCSYNVARYAMMLSIHCQNQDVQDEDRYFIAI